MIRKWEDLGAATSIERHDARRPSPEPLALSRGPL